MHIRTGEEDDQCAKHQDTACHQKADAIHMQPDGLDIEFLCTISEKVLCTEMINGNQAAKLPEMPGPVPNRSAGARVTS